jgi:hypothetical protein
MDLMAGPLDDVMSVDDEYAIESTVGGVGAAAADADVSVEEE